MIPTLERHSIITGSVGTIFTISAKAMADWMEQLNPFLQTWSNAMAAIGGTITVFLMLRKVVPILAGYGRALLSLLKPRRP